ncbi:MAG: hypothetical protein WBE68_11150 [Candidatus Nitrosopolaris sp.]
MTVNDLEIPPNATIRQEYVKCGNPDCRNSHGPYLYAYWKGCCSIRLTNSSYVWICIRTNDGFQEGLEGRK